ncbi:MAG: TIR domain-containing protein [Proteobacteria bacterium]|nr:TIR domain-containing protein [Pseudomonadota bacterium]
MTTSSRAVFLSYASEDADAALALCEALRAAGIDVWFDRHELKGGDAWDRSIRQRIRDCALFIPLVSAHTEGRLEGYFRREWRIAVDRLQDMDEGVHFLVPVALDDTPERGAHVPEAFLAVQWVRIAGRAVPPTFAPRVAALLAGADAAQATTTHGRHAVEPPPARRSRRVASIVVAGLAVLASAAAAAWLSFFQPEGAHSSQPYGGGEKSIAVLPFVDLSEGHNQEYFADGMAEEILSLLESLPDLRVIGRTSSFQFRRKNEDLRTIGSTLGAVYVLEGSVRRSGDRLRVTAQLSEAHDGTRLWSESYDRTLADTIALQQQLAGAVAHALHVEIAAIHDLRGRAPTHDIEAYDSYLRGLHELEILNQSGFEYGAAHFQHAIDLQPTFVPAMEQLARAFTYQADFGYSPPQVAWEHARAMAQKVLDLDRSSAVAHAVLGNVSLQYDLDWRTAEREFRTAMLLAPSSSYVRWLAASEYLAVGNSQEAGRVIDAARAMDPLDPIVHIVAGWVYQQAGRPEAAVQACRRALEIAPTYAFAHFELGQALLVAGKPEDALVQFQAEPEESGKLAGLAIALHALGRDREASENIERLRRLGAKGWTMGLSFALAARGDNDGAFRLLDEAWAAKDPDIFRLKGHPLLRNLEADPRYRALLRKMNLPE